MISNIPTVAALYKAPTDTREDELKVQAQRDTTNVTDYQIVNDAQPNLAHKTRLLFREIL
jgi:hypothetical protein